eukprot:403337634
MSISTNVSSQNLLSEQNPQNPSVQHGKLSIQSSRPPLARRITTQQSQRQMGEGLNFKQFEKFYLNNVARLVSEEVQRESNSAINSRRNSNSSLQQYVVEEAKQEFYQQNRFVRTHRTANKYLHSKDLQIDVKGYQKPSRDIQSAKSSNNSLVRAGQNIMGGFQFNHQNRNQSKHSNRSDAKLLDCKAIPIQEVRILSSNHDSEINQRSQSQLSRQALLKKPTNVKINKPYEYKRLNSDVQNSSQNINSDGQTERLRRLNSIQTNVALPHITAQSWSIYDVNALKFVQGDTLLTVSRCASRTNGTSACLREGDQLTIDQLFYGLMLPSGNDAAYCLAEFFGQYLQENKYKDQAVTSFQFQWSIVRFFLKEMNLNAFKLRMFQSQFDSPHGLANKHNYSTASDICLLGAKCMQIEKFRQVVNTIEMQTEAKFSPNGKKLTKYNWENTNKLLGQKDGFIGCKTGVTNPAGPCFCGGYEKDGHKYIVVVLCSKSMEARWVEVPKIVEWAIKKKRVTQDTDRIKYPSKYEDQSKIVRIM